MENPAFSVLVPVNCKSPLNSGSKVIRNCNKNIENNFINPKKFPLQPVYSISNFDNCRLSLGDKLNSRCSMCKKGKNKNIFTSLICSSCNIPCCAECYDCHRRQQLISALQKFQKKNQIDIKVSACGKFLKIDKNIKNKVKAYVSSENFAKCNNIVQSKNFNHNSSDFLTTLTPPETKDFNFEVFKPAIHVLKETYGAISESMFDDKGKFKCMFFQDSYMKDFFNFYPKRICIDATCTFVTLDIVLYLFLSEDSNGQIEIISAALVSGEDIECIKWLLTVFKKHNPRWREIKMLVVDALIKDREILKANFPDAYILICFFHSTRTLKKDLSSNDFCHLSHEQKTNILKYFEKMILAYSEMEYNLLYQQLFTTYNCIREYFDTNWHCIKNQWRVRMECCDFILYAMNAFLNFIENSFKPAFLFVNNFCEFVHKFFFVLKLLRIERYHKNPMLFQSVQLSLYSKFTPQYHISNVLTPYIAEIVIHQLDMSAEININPGVLLDNYVFSRYGTTAISNAFTCTCKFFLLTSLFCCHVFAVRRVFSFPVFDETLCEAYWTQKYYQDIHIMLKDSLSQNVKAINYFLIIDKLLPLILNCSPNLYQQRIFLLSQLVRFWKKGEDVYLQFDGSDQIELTGGHDFILQTPSVYVDSCTVIKEESVNSELFNYSRELNVYADHHHVINSHEQRNECSSNIFSTNFQFEECIEQRNHINIIHLSTVICETKQSCIKWLQYMGFLPNSMICPSCGNNMKYETVSKLSDGVMWICTSKKKNKRNCIKRCSVRRGTWFEGTNMSLEQILYFTYMWINSYSSHQIIFELGISAATYSAREKFFKRVCSYQQFEDQDISSNSIIDTWIQSKTGQDTLVAFLKDISSFYEKDKKE